MNADEIRELLSLTGWSEAGLADRLDVSQYAVRKWLRGSACGGPAAVLMRQWLVDQQTPRKPKVEATT